MDVYNFNSIINIIAYLRKTILSGDDDVSDSISKHIL